MNTLRELKSQILAPGSDLWIDEDDVNRIRELLPTDGSISVTDLQVLTEMRVESRAVCAAFDELYFPALRESLLADGRICAVEHLTLLRMLYGGGGVDEAEKQFLRELRRDLTVVTPEFEALYQDAFSDDT